MLTRTVHHPVAPVGNLRNRRLAIGKSSEPPGTVVFSDISRMPFRDTAGCPPALQISNRVAACAAVIPCFNEGASIATLVVALRRQLPLVLVVDDGSTDGTAVAAKEAGAVVIRHGRNLGKGASLRTGLSQARKLGFEWGVALDGDGQHAPADWPAFRRCAEQTGVLLVVGNRMHDARAIPWLRRRVNRWMSRQLSRRAGQCLPDTQCGFRLIHLETWAGLPLNTEHFEIESEMLMSFLAAEHPVAFVPIQVIGRARGSHIHPLADSLRWWKWWRGLRPPATRPAEMEGRRQGNSKYEFERVFTL